jgi:hypothetical protein
MLQPDNGELAVEVLLHISRQLGNSTLPAFEPSNFTVATNVAAVNILLFLSLALVLIDAFLAMLVKSWLREFDRGWRKFNAADLRAEERERRVQGIDKWKMGALVSLLPLLIQTSLSLFGVGVLVLIFPLHLPSAYLSLIGLLVGVILYILTTGISIRDPYAPFSSSISRGLYSFLHTIKSRFLGHRHTTRPETKFSKPLVPSDRNSHLSLDIALEDRPPLRNDPASQTAGSTPNARLLVNSPGAQPPSTVPRSVSLSRIRLEENGFVGGAETSEQEQREEPDEDHSVVVPLLPIHKRPTRLIHFKIAQRLAQKTSEAADNIPVFLELLDQPVKYPYLRPRAIPEWQGLLQTAVRQLSDLSTFTAPIARTIARTFLACYDADTFDRQLHLRLCHSLDCSGSESDGEPLDSLYFELMRYCFSKDQQRNEEFSVLCTIVRRLEKSEVADAELFWLVDSLRLYGLLSADGAPFGIGFLRSVIIYLAKRPLTERQDSPLTWVILRAVDRFLVEPQREEEKLQSLCERYITPALLGHTNNCSDAGLFCQINSIEISQGPQIPYRLIENLSISPDALDPIQRASHYSLRVPILLTQCKLGVGESVPQTLLPLLQNMEVARSMPELWDAWDAGCDRNELIACAIAISKKGQMDTLYPTHSLDLMEMVMKYDSPLEESAVRFIQSALDYLQDGTLSFARKTGTSFLVKWDTIVHRELPLNSYWAVLLLENACSQPCSLTSDEIGGMEWRDGNGIPLIARTRLALYDPPASLDPEPPLLRLFLSSDHDDIVLTALRWSLKTVYSAGAPGGQVPEMREGDKAFGLDEADWNAHRQAIQAIWDPMVFTKSQVDLLILLLEELAPRWDTLPALWRSRYARVLLITEQEGNALAAFNGVPTSQAFWRACMRLDRWLKVARMKLQSSAEAVRYERSARATLPFIAALLWEIPTCLPLDVLKDVESWLPQLSKPFENAAALTRINELLEPLREKNTGRGDTYQLP